MTQFDNQEEDTFKFGETESLKLVSLETGISNTTRKAYSSYTKESTTKEEIEIKEKENIKKEEIKQQEVKKTKIQTKNLSQPKATKVTKSLKQEEIPKPNNNIPTIIERLDELKDSIEILWANIDNTISALLYKLGTIIMKPIVKLYSLIAKVLEIPLGIANKFISSFAVKIGEQAKKVQPIKDNIEQENQEVKIKTASFSDMIELNIIFCDNYKNNFYNKSHVPGFKLSKMEEELIMNMAIDAIKECAEFTVELPPPTEGIYKDIPIHKIMEQVTSEDVYIFLGFVKNFPGKYIGKTWKISETFATWLINNSPTG